MSEEFETYDNTRPQEPQNGQPAGNAYLMTYKEPTPEPTATATMPEHTAVVMLTTHLITIRHLTIIPATIILTTISRPSRTTVYPLLRWYSVLWELLPAAFPLSVFR